MVQAANPGQGNNLTAFYRLCLNIPGNRSIFGKIIVGSVEVVIGEVLSENPSQMVFTKNDKMVETIPAYCADQAFNVAILPRTSGGSFNLLSSGDSEFGGQFTEFHVSMKSSPAERSGDRCDG
jgi:hypothetical protein